MYPAHKQLQLILILVMLSLSAGTGICLAQAPVLNFHHIGKEQGLSNNTIESIYQDSRGFMWFGTRDGLNCFDGYQIKIYRSNASDSSTLSDNYIRCIYEDSQKTLWIGTINGLNRFNKLTNTFTRFKHKKKEVSSLSHNYITAICEDKNKNLWIASLGGGLNKLNRKNNSFTHFRHQPKTEFSIASDFVGDVEEDRNGNLWVATDNGLCSFDSNRGSFTRFPQKTGNKSQNIIRLIEKDGQGNLWLGTNDQGILKFNISSKTFQEFRHSEVNSSSLGSNLVRCLLIDKKGNFWAGGVNGGLSLFDKRNASFFNYLDEPGNIQSLSQRTISALFEDNQGNLWVGTHRGGINVYMPKAQKFSLYRRESKGNSLSYNDVKAFCEDDRGNIWVGTDGGGLNLFDQTTNTFKHYRYNPYNPSSIGSDAVLHIFQDREKNIWISTWGGGLNLFDRESGTFKRFVHNTKDRKSISSDFVQQVLEDSKGNLWVATYYGGLNLFDRKSETFRQIVKGSSNTILLGNNIVSLADDDQGNIWIGTDDGGLNRYNLQSQKFEHYFVNQEKMPDIRVIFIDSKKNVWVGHSGLYKLNRKANKFSPFTTKAKLSSEFIKGIAEDKNGNFWISTSNGLTFLNPNTLATRKYNTGDGLQGSEFEANACLTTRKGQIFFGGVNGFNAFFPDTIQVNTFAPPVYLTSFQIFNKEVIPGSEDSPLKADISYTKEIELNYKQSTISFSFSALNYIISRNNKYAYKLEGFDKDWVNIGSSQKAYYTNLDPGEYTFRVIAANNDGIWNSKGTSVKIIIHPPFWDTWWFISLIAIALAGGGYKYLNYRRHQELKQLEEKKKEEMHQVQLQFFTNISHEFRTPLSLILGPLEKLLNDGNASPFRHYYSIMFRNANRLMNLINELMDFRKIESGALRLRVMPGQIGSFIQEITEDFKEAAAEREIEFKTDLQVKKEVWFDRQVLEKIVLNLINNSFKYTNDKGTIQVKLLNEMKEFAPLYENTLVIKSNFASKNYIYIQIIDTGIGISKDSIEHLFQRYFRIADAHLGSGVGLAFVKSLTLLHKGHIFVSSTRHQGTEIIIAIPSGKEDYCREEIWVSSPEATVKLESLQFKNLQHLRGQKEEQVVAPSKKDTLLKHLLIVDDNEELRSFLKDSLANLYTITEAINGRDGIEKTKEVLPDLIISDVMMPDMDGLEFCRLVKDDLEISHIPFLMLTAKNSLESEIEGVESGADFYFSKPISINLLVITLRNIFGQKQKLIDHYTRDHHAEVKELVHSAKDKEFMTRLLTIIDNQLINPDLDIGLICTEIGMSRTKLYQKIKSITGQPIGEFIRTIRLKKAVEIMTHEDVTLVEVMYRVGIQTQSYFTKAFKKQFGKTPGQFLQEIKQTPAKDTV